MGEKIGRLWKVTFRSSGCYKAEKGEASETPGDEAG